MLGGLIGVIALAFAWHLIPTGKSESPELGKIKERIAKLEATPAPAPDTEALAKLDGRIKALEGQTPPDIAGLTDRVAQLEQALKALAEAAKNGGSVTDAAAITEQITEAEQRIQATLDKALADAEPPTPRPCKTMQAAIDEMKAKIAALAEAGPAASLPTSRRSPSASPSSRRRSTRAWPARNRLPRRSPLPISQRGRAKAAPSPTELATIKSFVPDPGDLGPLPAYADKGIPTVPELARSFAASRDAALAAAAPAPSGSLIDRLLASASTLIKVKRVDEAATGDSPSAVLARAEALLDKGDLAGSVKQVETLQGGPRDAFSTWLDRGACPACRRRRSCKGSKRRLLASAGSAPRKGTRLNTMIRVLFFILCVVAAALGLAWFADRPGTITVEWLGYQIETSAFVGALAIVALVVFLILLWAVLRYLLTRPAAIAAYTRERRKQQGLDALSRGLLAIGVGDRALAQRYAGIARRNLPNEPSDGTSPRASGAIERR